MGDVRERTQVWMTSDGRESTWVNQSDGFGVGECASSLVASAIVDASD